LDKDLAFAPAFSGLSFRVSFPVPIIQALDPLDEMDRGFGYCWGREIEQVY
jgi:hypothetical protein